MKLTMHLFQIQQIVNGNNNYEFIITDADSLEIEKKL